MNRKDIILDTNAVIRFILANDELLSSEIAVLINTTSCIVPIEVIAEVVYNLRDKYFMDRSEISERLKEFILFKENMVAETNTVRFALNLFASSKLDFVDCILVAYARINGNLVFTLDDELNKQLQEKSFYGRH
jgi:predicted nucleic-acid-binding protein